MWPGTFRVSRFLAQQLHTVFTGGDNVAQLPCQTADLGFMATFLQWFSRSSFTCWWRSTYPRLRVIVCSVSVAIRGARVLYLPT